MSEVGDEGEPTRARKVPREPEGPESVLTRGDTVARYLIRRGVRRRRRFLERAATTSLRMELARNLFLAGCIVLDGVVIPQPIFVMPSPWGWPVTAVLLLGALYLEYRAYLMWFALPDDADGET